jgi:hypothetical protein
MRWITREKAVIDRVACPWLASREEGDQVAPSDIPDVPDDGEVRAP